MWSMSMLCALQSSASCSTVPVLRNKYPFCKRSTTLSPTYLCRAVAVRLFRRSHVFGRYMLVRAPEARGLLLLL